VAGRSWRRWRKPQLALIVLVIALIVGYAISALHDSGTGRSKTSSPATTSSAVSTPSRSGTSLQSSDIVALSSLPAQAGATVALIEQGGPFPYPQDGVVFNNAEKLLPQHPRGFYHEYTVPTPGAGDRGARRIVTGKDGSYYYTGDHYESFVRVDVTQ
jgi:ribonuclease T1